VHSYDEYERALSEVDAVYLVLPNHLHREYAVRAAQAGVHVLCEKPMAMTEGDCDAMIEAADANGVKLMIAYRLHFEEANLEAIRLVRSGKLGDPRIFDSAFTQQMADGNIRVTQPAEKGGGPVYDMGVYCINAARYLFQAEPTGVLASSANTGREKIPCDRRNDVGADALSRGAASHLHMQLWRRRFQSLQSDLNQRVVDGGACLRLLHRTQTSVDDW